MFAILQALGMFVADLFKSRLDDRALFVWLYRAIWLRSSKLVMPKDMLDDHLATCGSRKFDPIGFAR
jgi:hypothetical protein